MAARSGLSTPRVVTPTRRRALALRIEEHGLPAVLEAIERIGRSRFCRGGNDRGWRADLDFLCQAKSLVSILEGKYDDRQSVVPNSRAPPSYSAVVKPGQTREEYLAAEKRRSERSFKS